MNRSSSQKTLKEWVLLNAAKPLYVSLAIITLVQLCFIAAKIQTNRQDMRQSVSNLAHVLSVGMFQKNRMLIETSSTYALSSSEMSQICIFDAGKLSYSLPIAVDGDCVPSNSLLYEVEDVQLKSMPQYQVRFLLPRFPGLSGIVLMSMVSLLLSFSIFYVLFVMLKKIKSELIEPLSENIRQLDVLDRDYEKREFFEIVELDQLIKSYFSKMIQVKDLMDKEVQLSKEALVGRISAQLTHDMRAPIGTFERLLFMNTDEFPKMKEAIRESVNRLYTMVEALRHGEVENIVHKNWTDLDFSFGGNSLLWKAENHKIRLQVPEDRIKNIHLDQAKVERAWINLASNAIEFAKNTVKVETFFRNSDLHIRVLDDGPGVPEEFLAKLFHRGATFGKADGTGLGLAYVKQVAQGHGGDAHYYRQDDWTVFEMVFPSSKALDLNQTQEEESTVPQSKPREVRTVAICLQPTELSLIILGKLASMSSQEYIFKSVREEAAIVVSNNEDIMFEVLEREDQEYFSLAQFKNDTDLMMEILKRKFNLST